MPSGEPNPRIKEIREQYQWVSETTRILAKSLIYLDFKPKLGKYGRADFESRSYWTAASITATLVVKLPLHGPAFFFSGATSAASASKRR